jgi:AcrR family transcriptional regulator
VGSGANGATQLGGGQHAGRPRILAPVTQRERLLDAMARTVARQGYASTSVADVLKTARISRRTFYEKFVDKEDCFLAAYDAISELCEDRVVAAYRAERAWEPGVASAYDALLTALAAEPDFARLGVVEILAAGPRGVARRDATLRRFARFVEHTRERLGTTAVPGELVAQAIAGGIQELLYSQIVRGQTDRLPDLAGDLMQYTFMLLGIKRNPASRAGQIPT